MDCIVYGVAKSQTRLSDLTLAKVLFSSHMNRVSEKKNVKPCYNNHHTQTTLWKMKFLHTLR